MDDQVQEEQVNTEDKADQTDETPVEETNTNQLAWAGLQIRDVLISLRCQISASADERARDSN